ncbi:type II secretion system F family protein [Actinotalea sp. M2MS4P-6]|uniref:type II secretion system F family protein n=1 Tax=Actinotalea sp. M2MS4P-6 TaxID=2983762 RepID=UPI0021E4407C|nr:type II secretion system F family protein [Actinotalea sp. M2MS4P-6]MCV2394902.1 type II secretion system F family protein [Actinotalea sp. M2MS4P-6]
MTGETELVGAVRQVAAAVRAGATVERAWSAVGVGTVHGVPRRADLVALRATPGALAGVRAAARLTARSGAPPAPALEAVADALDADAELDARRRAALAGPAASARVLGALPAIGPLLGLAIGADPFGVLLDGRLGTMLLVAGGVLAAAGRGWSRALLGAARAVASEAPTGRRPRIPGGRAARLRGRATDEREPEVGVALLLELLAAAHTAGASVPDALRAVGSAAGGSRGEGLVRAATLLGMGAEWSEAWVAAPAELSAVSDGLRPAWQDGTPPAGLLHAAADRRRRARVADATEAAGRLGVRLLLPLGLCHLPAFVLVGLMPVLVSLARDTVAW